MAGTRASAAAADARVKRKRGDRRDWTRVVNPDYRQAHHHSGLITAPRIPAVREPLVVTCCGERTCIADAGYLWLTHYPPGARHVVTTQFDDHRRPVQWYVDIVDSFGLGEDRRPWFDDLYLDVVASPAGRAELLDADELDDALAPGRVTRAQYELAWREARDVMTALPEGRLASQALTFEHQRVLERAFDFPPGAT